MIRDLCSLLETSADSYAERTAVRERASDGTFLEYSYARMRQDVHTLAGNLLRAGCGGARTAIIGDNCYRWIVCFWAVILSGGVAIPFDRELPPDDIESQLNACGAQAVFCSRRYLSKLDKCQSRVPVFDLEAAPEAAPFSETERGSKTAQGNDFHADGQACPDPDSVAAILFTSGTAGARKAVTLTHRNLCANIQCVVSFDFANSDFTNCLSLLPIFHCYELFCHVFPAFTLGKTFNFPGSLRYLEDDLVRLKPGVIPVVPQLLSSIYHAAKLLGDHLPCLVIGGAAPDLTLVRKMLSSGFRVCSGYGMTETSPLISIADLKLEQNETYGMVIPYVKVKIDHPDTDGIGEILVSGPNVTPGYFEDAGSNQASFTSDGWLRTGDIGCLTDSGLRLIGRKKSTIVLENGKNVQPEELEQKAHEELPYAEELAVCEATVHAGGADKRVLCLVMYLPDGPEKEQARTRIENDIKRLNSRLAAWQTLACYAVSPTPLPVNALKKISRVQLPAVLKELEKQFVR